MNYPQDIRKYDLDPRSPFYDSSLDDAVEQLELDLYTDIKKCLVLKLKPEDIDRAINDVLDCKFSYDEWLDNALSEDGHVAACHDLFLVDEDSYLIAVASAIIDDLEDEVFRHINHPAD